MIRQRSNLRIVSSFPTLVILALLAVQTPNAAAQVNTIWNNSGTDFGLAGNWSLGAPGLADTAIFNTTTNSGIIMQPNVGTGYSFQNLIIGLGPNMQNYTFSGVGTLILSANSAGGALTTRGTINTVFNGPSVAGFSGANLALFNIGQGSNITFQGGSVANTNIGAITLRGGTITVDSVANNTGTQRLASAANPAFTGGGSGLIFKGNTTGSTFNGLTGALTLNSGDGSVRVEQPVGAAGATAVTFGSLDRNNTNTSVNFFNSGSGTLGAGGINPSITFSTAPTVRQGVISTSAATTIPYAYVSTSNTNADWANYGVNGVVAATTSSFAGDFNLATVGTNVRFEPIAPGTVTLNATANQLATVNLAPTVAGVTLDATGTRMNTFGVMLSGPNDLTITGGNLFSSGAGTKTLIVANPNAVLSTTSTLTTTSQPFNKSGPGMLALTGTSGNQIGISTSGTALNLNGGTLRVNTTNFDLTLPTLRLRGGTLEYDVSSASASFTRSLGTTGGTFNWSNGGGSTTQLGSGGFSAFSNTPGNDLTVNIGGATAALTWNDTVGANDFFVKNGYALQFGSKKSNATVVWQNPIALDSGVPGAYNNRTIEVTQGVGNAADQTRFDGVISGSSSTDLFKTGNGVMNVTGANNYQGKTIVQTGTLAVNNTGGSGTGDGPVNVATTGKISGNGTIAPNPGNDVDVAGTIAPGNSVGQLNFGMLGRSTVVSVSGHYDFELANAGDFAPPNTGQSSASAFHDVMTVTGQLLLNTPFRVDITSLGMTGFDPNFTYSWTIATASNLFGASGIDVGMINGTEFLNATGMFFLGTTSNQLFLNYVPVPEPATVLAIAGAGLGIGGWIRKRRKPQTATV